MVEQLDGAVEQPVLAERTDLRGECHLVGRATVPDHLCHELLGLLPLLGDAQALEHGVVGVGVGRHGHGGDEAERVVEAAGAAVPVDERGVGDDVGPYGGAGPAVRPPGGGGGEAGAPVLLGAAREREGVVGGGRRGGGGGDGHGRRGGEGWRRRRR